MQQGISDKETQWVEAIKKGDKKAFEQLYDAYSSRLYAVAFKILKSQDASSDAVQNAFIKIWNKMDTFHNGKGSLYGWMIYITRNVCIDYLRNKNNKKSIQSIDDAVYQLEARYKTESNKESIDIPKWVNTLKEDQKVIIEMAYFQGYSQSEIAERLELPLGTVKTRARSAMKELRKIFGVE